MYKKDEPCEAYFGNLCTGFGNEDQTCFCGWDRWDHPSEKADWPDFLKELDNG